MTKAEYLVVRNQPEIPMDIWYEYYLERGGTNIGLSLFVEAFTNVLLGTIVMTKSGPKTLSLKTALISFYKYYNQKFGL